MAIGGGGITNTQINVNTNIDNSIRNFNRLNQTINNFSRQAASNVTRTNRAIEGMGFHLRRINANIVLLGFGFVGLTHKVEEFVQRGAEMELFTKRMEAVSGSVVDAQKDMGNIIDIAQKVPFQLQAITRSFIKLKAAGIEPITDEQGNGPLKALLDAMAAFGGDSETLDRVTIALTQMAGKGVVSMEELRQQLGESIPTALRIAARESHMTVAAFVKDVSRGKITWEEFAKVFFTGLERNYAGAAERLMSTFRGASQQLSTQLDILAKTIFVDTGTMRYFTAATRLAVDKLREFDKYLKSREGQQWIDGLWKGFQKLAVTIAKGLEPTRALIGAIIEIGSTIADVTDGLPPEIVGTGLLGYTLFGRAGLSIGLAVGVFRNQIGDVSKLVIKFIENLDSIFNKFGGSISNAAIGGLIGFRLAGPYGALSGAVIGELIAISNDFEDLVRKVVTGAYVIKEAFTFKNFEFRSLDQIVIDAVEGANKALEGTFPKFEFKPKVDKEEFKKNLETATVGVLQDIGNRVEEQKQNLVHTIEGISTELANESAKIKDIKIADFTASFPDKETAIAQLDDYRKEMEKTVDSIQTRLSELNTLRNENMHLGLPFGQWDAEIKQLDATLKEAVRLRNDTFDQMKNIDLMPEGGIAQQTADLLNSVQQFASGIDTSFQSVDSMRQKIAGWTEEERKLKEQIDQSNLSVENKKELTNVLDAISKELAGSTDLVNQKFKEMNPPVEGDAKAIAELTRKMNDLSAKGKELTLGKSWTGEAERIRSATDDIQSYIDDIAVAIEDINKKVEKGLIPSSVANEAISNLRAMADAAQSSSARMIEMASDVGQAWNKLGHQIYDAIENSIGDAIYGLVTRTKSLRDVLVELWQSVTRAVSNYLAKLIMISIFGGGSSGGGIFGSIFGANTGAQLSFAGGGMVDGRTGFDNNMVSMRVSRGERVTVETAAQQRANNRLAQGGAVYNIYALDGNSVERILLQHGGVLQRSLTHQHRLNRQ